MARRTGLWTIRTIAYQMCRKVTEFTPLISSVYGDNTALIAALAAANAACATLVAAADESLPVGD